MTIKAIVFDLGGVVLEMEYEKFLNEVIMVSPLHKPNTFLLLEFWRQSDIYHQGKITDDEFYAQTCELLNFCELDKERFFESFNSVISQINEEVVDVLRDIRELGKYKLIALSNINKKHWDYLKSQDCGFLKLFDDFILSHQVKMIKPNPEIFKLTIERAGCEPEEILYVDDGLNNVRSASDLGIKGINFTIVEELRQNLREHGVEV